MKFLEIPLKKIPYFEKYCPLNSEERVEDL